jgi:hypothetical protein
MDVDLHEAVELGRAHIWKNNEANRGRTPSGELVSPHKVISQFSQMRL